MRISILLTVALALACGPFLGAVADGPVTPMTLPAELTPGTYPGSASPETGMEEGAAPTPTPPVQTDGIITLEARRTFGGTLSYLAKGEGDEIRVEWNAGIAYTESRDVLGALRHIWIYSDDPRVTILEKSFDYELEADGARAVLTLTFTAEYEDEAYAYAERFEVLPEGDGAKVTRLNAE